MPSSLRIVTFSLSFTICLTLAGCKVAAPMHVWQPPELESAVGRRMGIGAINGIDGTAELAETIRNKMLAEAPSDIGRELAAIDPTLLPSEQTISLVSAIEENGSDVATASLARRIGLDYVLQGEVLASREQRLGSQVDFDPSKPLRLSWKLNSVSDDRHIGGKPVVVTLESARIRYPDLASVVDPKQAMMTAAVRETYRLVTPSVKADQVFLANSYGMPGSKAVREANDLARQGRWAEAESIWRRVSTVHPSSASAIHNLALAMAAKQEFSEAKLLARKAIRRKPVALHKQTLVWIETKQREYHEAFNLPDPPEGWFVSRK